MFLHDDDDDEDDDLIGGPFHFCGGGMGWEGGRDGGLEEKNSCSTLRQEKHLCSVSSISFTTTVFLAGRKKPAMFISQGKNYCTDKIFKPPPPFLKSQVVQTFKTLPE